LGRPVSALPVSFKGAICTVRVFFSTTQSVLFSNQCRSVDRAISVTAAAHRIIMTPLSSLPD
jgi:hypothetical protein